MRILFVCMGNICRSPSAEGVFRKALAGYPDLGQVQVDSAGTHDYHVGEPPDQRAIASARRRGIDISSLRARRVQPADFEQFDLILAMDNENLSALRRVAPAGQMHRVRLMLEFAEGTSVTEVPDPYYGGESGFERVLDLLEEASAGLLAHIRRLPSSS